MSLLKTAGAETALAELGLLSQEPTQKTAAIGGLIMRGLSGAGKFLGKGIMGAGTGAVRAAAEPFGRIGNWGVQRAGQWAGLSTPRIAQIQGLGKGMAREAVGFGLFSGGLGAAMADPGQRGEAFLRGFGSGALGGLAWRGASNLASAGLKRGLGAAGANVGKLEAAAASPWFRGEGLSMGQRMRGMSASALMGGVPAAAGLAASMQMPMFENTQTLPPYAQRAIPYAAYAAGSMMGAYPQHPMGYAYNPNLPMPQYGY